MSEVIFPALGMAFAAFAVWLAVRIVNRQERWAKWTALALVAIVLGYPLSFGPAVWIADRGWVSLDSVARRYSPIILMDGVPGEVLAHYGEIGLRSRSLTMLMLLIRRLSK